MVLEDQGFPDMVKEVRKQLGISQRDLATALGVSFATVNRWENGRTMPFNLARKQFDNFCREMVKQGKLVLSDSRD